MSDAAGGEVERGAAAEAAGADDGDAGVEYQLLAGDVEIAQA